MRKILGVLILAVVWICATGCNADNYTKIGTSGLSIIIPNGYVLTEDDFEEDQIAYYYKDDSSIDFDVYQWHKEGVYTLEDEAEYFAAEYDTVPEKLEINGLTVMKYVSKETYDNNEYTVVNYMAEDEESIVEISFWTVDTKEEYDAVNEIINTIRKS